MKVLLSAYACEPGRGSEPGVGWNWAHSLCEHVDVTVITRANNQEVIEDWYRKHTKPAKSPKFVYYDPPAFVLAMKRQKVMPVQLFYVLWQIGIVLKMRKQIHDFDLLHHVTFNSMMLPGVWWRSPIPVILGPLGGTSCVSEQFRPLFGNRIWKEKIREQLIRYWRVLPWLRLSMNKASLIFCANSETKRQLDQCYVTKTEVLLETGVNEIPEFEEYTSCSKEPEVVRMIWIGTIEPWKALTVALNGLERALQSVGSGNLILDIVGDGREMEQAKQQAKDMGILGDVVFHGWLAPEQVKQLLGSADSLVFTSVKDTSGNVVLEAMKHGLPVICFNHQGVGDMTTSETAIRIEPSNLDQAYTDFGAAMLRLCKEPDLKHSLGKAGKQRIKECYLWEQKAAQMKHFYSQILK